MNAIPRFSLKSLFALVILASLIFLLFLIFNWVNERNDNTIDKYYEQSNELGSYVLNGSYRTNTDLTVFRFPGDKYLSIGPKKVLKSDVKIVGEIKKGGTILVVGHCHVSSSTFTWTHVLGKAEGMEFVLDDISIDNFENGKSVTGPNPDFLKFLEEKNK